MARILPFLVALALSSCAGVPEEAAPRRVDVRADWTLADTRGEVHEVGRALERGEPVVLVFWSTWCGACVEEAPVIEAAHREHPDVPVFGVVSGAERDVAADDVASTVARLGLTYPQVLDRDLSLATAFDVLGTPTIVVLGKDGEVLFYGHEAPEDWSSFAG
ncbi:MAG: TlpA disulfide reductase family protein [Planctomycetota bacterium]